jgi:hypothetical protein
MYLTREQAAAKLVESGSTEESAGSLLDWALRIYPRSSRTNFDLITGFPAGVAGCTEMFTVAAW